MLKSIDILIGLSVVMLVASMAVTVMTGFITHLWNTRAKNLQQGIADLLRLVNPEFTEKAVNEISAAVLKHPLIRDGYGRMGTVIHREELTKLLMELATGAGPQKLEKDVQDALSNTLKEHGIADPEGTLASIRSMALQLEKTSPELSNMARANIAILHQAESHFVAKINTWFDQTMDRVSHRFTLSTRSITFACGLLLALGLQLDSVALVNRISVDEPMREYLSQQARNLARTDAPNAAPSRELFTSIINQGVVPLPKYPEDLRNLADVRHLFGILLTALLLSLGAPFWYNALNQLLQLRSKVAQEDDVQRKERQSTQEAVTPAALPVGTPAPAGAAAAAKA